MLERTVCAWQSQMEHTQPQTTYFSYAFISDVVSVAAFDVRTAGAEMRTVRTPAKLCQSLSVDS